MNSHLKLWVSVFLWLWFDRVVQDASGGTHPDSDSASSLSDANLLFEFLLGGVEVDQDSNILLLDEEMASMRKGKEFLSRINDGIPKSVRTMATMVNTMQALQKRPLTPDQFRNLVLSTVYAAHQAQAQERTEEREEWGGVLLQLANVTVYELRGSFLFNYA